MAGPGTVIRTREASRTLCAAPAGDADPCHAPAGVGVDVVDVARFRDMLAARGADLTSRVFTPVELRDAAGQPERLAARFAAKEAAAKALGTGIGAVGWRDVEVLSGPNGAPELRVSGAADRLAQAQGFEHWRVSLSHDANHAVAFVVAAGKEWSP